MTHATLLWSHWQDLLDHFAWGFSRPGYRRFAEWITAMALNVEEHTITQSLLALERPFDWKAMESFAEYGAWHPDRITRSLTNLVETAPGRLWDGYHVSALDDTKVHRSGEYVWVSTPTGAKIKVKAKVTEGIGPDTIFIPFHFAGWWQGEDMLPYYPEGAAPIVRGEAVNTATTYGYDRVTMMQESKTTLCQVAKT